MVAWMRELRRMVGFALAAAVLLLSGSHQPCCTVAALDGAPGPDADLINALAMVRRLSERLEVMEQRIDSAERAAACGSRSQFPMLIEGAEYAYSGCTRNVERRAVNSTSMCQAGTIKIYDTQTTNTSGART